MKYRWPKMPFWKLDFPKKSRNVSLRENVECGLHSGFPWCCIFWYITVWEAIAKWPWLRNIYHNWKDIEMACYVRCPLCKLLDRKPVRVRACLRELNGDHVLGPYLDEIGYRTWRPENFAADYATFRRKK